MSAERRTIAPYSVSEAGLANGGDLDIDPVDAPGGGPTVLEVTQVIHSGDIDLVFLTDTNGDGTFDLSVTLDSYTGAGAEIFEPGIRLYETDNQALRVTNTDGTPADASMNASVLGGLPTR